MKTAELPLPAAGASDAAVALRNWSGLWRDIRAWEGKDPGQRVVDLDVRWLAGWIIGRGCAPC